LHWTASALFAVSWAGWQPAFAATFTSEPVVILGSTQVAALGINDAGAIVGSVNISGMIDFIQQGSALTLPPNSCQTQWGNSCHPPFCIVMAQAVEAMTAIAGDGVPWCREGKVFLSEEKKQKTFAHLGSRQRGCWTVVDGLAPRCARLEIDLTLRVEHCLTRHEHAAAL
jgi:hypothetical protein